jgi:PAS domain S-box-containing protein
MATALSTVAPARVRDVAQEALAERASLAARMTAAGVAPALAAGDRAAAQALIGLLEAEPQLLYAVLLDDGDRVVASVNALVAEGARFRDEPDSRSQTDDGVWRVSAHVPPYGGRVYIGFSLDGVHQAVAAARSRSLGTALLVTLLGTAGIFGIAGLLTGRLRSIVRTVESVSAGNLSSRTELRSRDEIGWLGRSFDTMVARLQEAYAELQTSNRDLEERVTERTRLLRHQVDERNRAERALRESEHRFRTMFESAAVGIALLGRDGRFLESNSTLSAMLGYAATDLNGTPVASLVETQDRATWAELEQRLLAASEAIQEEIRFRTGDGRTLWSRVVASPVKNVGGAPALGIVMIDDVTGRKALEEQLRQSQKLEAVGRLAGGIAHDFNNLLTTINGISEVLLSEEPADASLAADLGEIRKAGERAASLTAQLLAFSRRQIVLPEVMDLNATIHDMAPMLSRLLGPDNALELDLEDGLEALRADPGQVAQVVMNLVVNARDAMPRGGRVRIETRNLVIDPHAAHLEGSHIRITVTDTGVGMDAATRQRIFEPFFTTKEQGKGTGLGLSTVYGIVQQAGGSIEVESEPGLGARFVIILPSLGRLPGQSAAPPVRPDPGGCETVLVVEDEDPVRELVSRILRKTGYTVLEGRNGVHALEVFESNRGRIDAILTDVVMPQMSGPELVRRLAAEQPGLPVLFMSGYTQDEVLANELDQRGTGFIQKPMSPGALTRKLRELLDNQAN